MRRWPLRTESRRDTYRSSGAWYGRTIADDARALARDEDGSDRFLGEARATNVTVLLAEAEALLAGLNRLGIGKGDVVSLMLPNWLEAAVINLAAALGGLIVNPIVPIYRAAETRAILADCGSKAILVPALFRNFDYLDMMASIAADLPDLSHVVSVRDYLPGRLSYETLIKDGNGSSARMPKVDPASVKMVMYTSGTTGRPKGVLHTHETLARVIAFITEYWQVKHDEAVLVPSPVTHVSGYCHGLERPFLARTRTVLMERWNADTAVGLIDRHAVSITVAATPFLQELVDAAVRQGSALPSLRIFQCGGASVPPDLIHRANATLARAPACRAYGCSEAPNITLGFRPDRFPEQAAATDGRIVDFDVRILDDHDRPVAVGEEGEIVVRGPALFLGYVDQAETDAAFTPDGYYRTGDVGRMTDEHGILITGRKKDIIIRGGENISAKEIEDALLAHPNIFEASVVGIPHPRLGEGICVFVQKRGDAIVTVETVAEFLKASGLAPQKFPERVEQVDAMPRTASGKIRKDVLRAMISGRLA